MSLVFVFYFLNEVLGVKHLVELDLNLQTCSSIHLVRIRKINDPFLPFRKQSLFEPNRTVSSLTDSLIHVQPAADSPQGAGFGHCAQI